MPPPMVELEELGKRFRKGGQHQAYKTLRDDLVRFLTRPFRSAQRSLQDDDFWALRDVSLTIEQGEVVGLIGRNGAGKTTLLKVVSRITHPTSGRAKMYGRVGSLLEVGTGFHPELTGRENVYLNGSVLGMRRAEVDAKFDEIVAFSELESFLDTPVKHYSSGMYVRLAFSVAAHLEPEILLIDEVLSVGDLAFQKRCLGKMHEAAGKGLTVLLVSHHLHSIKSLCQRAIWLDEGRVRRDGDALEVCSAYEQAMLEVSGELTAAAERDPSHGAGPGLHIARVELRDAEGVREVYRHNGSLKVCVELAGEAPQEEFELEFQGYKDTGAYAFSGASGALHDVFFSPGVRKIEIELGPLVVTNGRYHLTLLLLNSQREPVDRWEYACAFNVIDCQPFKTRREINNPVCVVDHSFRAVE